MADSKKGRVSSKRGLKTRYSQLDKKFKFLTVFGIIFCVAGIPLIIWGGIWAYNTYAIGGEEEPEETPTTKLTSTFSLYSNVDGEDISSWAEMDIWTPKSGATFEEGYEDITALTLNFERAESGKDADDIAIDLRDHAYAWAEITGGPSAFWDNTFYLLIGGANYDYTYYAHDRSSDVNFNIVDSDTMGQIAYGTASAASAAGAKGVDSNYTAILMPPLLTTTNCHYGALGWEMDATEFGELTTSAKKERWDESNWCDQWPAYDPTVDTSNEYVRDFEVITNTFVLKFTMNTSISVVDLNAAQVNCTIERGFPIDTLVSGTNLYLVWYEGFDFDPDPYSVNFELTFGAAINVTTIQSGRVNVPSTISSVTDFAAYSTIGA